MPLFLQRRPYKPKTFCGRSNATEGNYGVFPVISISDADMDRERYRAKMWQTPQKHCCFPEEPIELSDARTERLDEIDNAVYECLCVILQKTEDDRTCG